MTQPNRVMLFNDDPETGKIWSFALSQRSIETILVIPTQDSTDPRPEQHYDLIMIELHGSPVNAVNLVRNLRSETTVPILVLLSTSDEGDALQVYDAGADECIFKPIGPRLLLAKIKVWLNRSWTVPTSILDSIKAGDFHLQPTQRQLILKTGAAIKLTNLEYRLVHLLISHPRQVLETSVIVERVWGHTEGDGSTLVKNLVYRLRRKIEANPAQPHHIQSFPGEGYLFEP